MDQTLQQYVWGKQYVDELVQVGWNQDPRHKDTGSNRENNCERFFWACQDANWNALGLPRLIEAARVSRGLVACVVNGRTKDFCWSGTPFLLWLAMQEAGLFLRKPLIFRRDGIPGSGGPDWFKDNYELVICGSRHSGRLPTINNKAMGHPPKFKPGGRPSHRRQDGSRVNDGYMPPEIANPGNLIDCLVGGGHMGHKLPHENEAPFPEYLAEWVIRSLSRPGSLVVDVMAGTPAGYPFAVSDRCGAAGIDPVDSHVVVGIRCSDAAIEPARVGRIADVFEQRGISAAG